MSILPLMNPASSDEWIQFIGKYMINMGAIETTTRIIIGNLNGTDKIKIYSDDLSARSDYLRVRYSNHNAEKHKKAMKFFDLLGKHIGFRNIVAHSGVIYADGPDGVKIMVGLFNLKPRDINNIAEIITIEEMKGRVNESAQLGATLLQLQNDFTFEKYKY